jgi:hypothetical protein
MRKPKKWGQPCPNAACSHYRLMDRGVVYTIAADNSRSINTHYNALISPL